MERKETILRVRDLRISFRTISGKVQAVRNVSYDLHKGETLAIVGESGSGKSVSTRAVLGILAKNAIVESGEILYDGKDILKLSEWELHNIRGEKISMIFQDPLSSLNPIVKIGKQLIEAPVLKAKSRRKENKALLQEILRNVENNGTETEEERKLLSLFRKAFEEGADLALPYEYAKGFLKDAKRNLDEVVFDIEKDVDADLTLHFLELLKLLPKAQNPYLFSLGEEGAKALKSIRKRIYPIYVKSRFVKRKKNAFGPFLNDAKLLLEKVDEALAREEPDFMEIGILRSEGKEVPSEREIGALNKAAGEAKQGFKAQVVPLLERAAAKSAQASLVSSKEAIGVLRKALEVYTSPEPQKKDWRHKAKEIVPFVLATIDPLAAEKDSYAYTFKDSLQKAIRNYFATIKTNEKERKRFEKEKAKYEALKGKGKEPSFKPVPPNVVEEERLRKNVTGILENLIAIYDKRKEVDISPRGESLFEALWAYVLGSKRIHTKFMAKMVALRLMSEVGIPEPRKRFAQYPFEFSGGMRQRIVIAIALTNNPEILICDEPTTALDVTIQAQILELINRIKEERRLSVIFITHNLGVVANMADKIAVMYAGKIVEYGTSNDIFYDPKHPYTWALLASMPDLETKEKLDAIPGTPPNMIYPPIGDAYAARNKYALKIDFRKEPPLYKVSPTHFARTWLLAENAPEVMPPEIVLKRIERMEERYGESIFKEMDEAQNEPDDEAFGPESVPASLAKSKRLDPSAPKKGDTDGK